MRRIFEIIDQVSTYNPQANTDLIERAWAFSASRHKDQLRKSGEKYLIHPIEVAGIVTDLKLDDASIAAALLHDTVEDTQTTPAEIEERFGKDVRLIVDGLTKISQITFRNKEEKQAENFRKMLVAMTKDIRVIVIKLADRLHNMRTLGFLSTARQQAISLETLEIYAPLANRLGIEWIKLELEDLSFFYLNREKYDEIAAQIEEIKKKRSKFIVAILEKIRTELETNKITAEVTTRVKSIYSTYKKMVSKSLTFDQVPDIMAFRVLVDSTQECYEVLGIIHSIYTHIPGRFKDYISIPKTNEYQSLHTTVVGPQYQKFEVQIRTREMHLIAEEGVAAHWKYKDGRIQQDPADKTYEWLRKLYEFHQDVSNPYEFLETLRENFFGDEVFVFTPQGDVKTLPSGSTPVDFAYAIHSDVGTECSSAKVNGKIVPLSYQLKTGDSVQIVTKKGGHPNKQWLNFVVSPRAKAKIRIWTSNEDRRQSIEIGQSVIVKELDKLDITVSAFKKDPKFEEALSALQVKDFEDLCAKVAYGKIALKQILQKLYSSELLEKLNRTEQQLSPISRIFKKAMTLAGSSSSAVQVDGIDNMLVRFARCCSPLPGEPIVGFISVGRGVTVHLANCPKVLNNDAERRVDVEWNNKGDLHRRVTVKIISNDTPGMLAKISSKIATEKINIASAKIFSTKDKRAVHTYEIIVSNHTQLDDILKSISSIAGIISATRVIRAGSE